MRQAGGLKPQDVLVLLKMAASKERPWRLVDLAQELGLSLSEVSQALERAKRARLIDSSKKNIVWPALLEFIVHGLKYVYPAEPGAICRGVPTAHSALPLSKDIVSEANDQYVWPSGDGTVRGQAIEPLYKSVPYAVSKDPGLHQLLALIDALRVGRARERQIAADELRRRLHAA
jgi:predicted transcriptional regulator